MNKKIIILLKFQAFTLTFISYVCLHSIRSAWSYSKTQISDSTQFTTKFLGIVDTSYVLAYALGMLLISNLSKKIKLNFYVGFGMIGASLGFSLFSL